MAGFRRDGHILWYVATTQVWYKIMRMVVPCITEITPLSLLCLSAVR